MKRLLWLAAFLSPIAAALDYQEALDLAGARPPVLAARVELADAQTQFARVRAEPTALRLERLKARQRLDLAAAELRLARVRAAAEIGRAYTGVLSAQRWHAVSRQVADVARRAYEIARLRYVKGGISRQDLRQAELEWREAQDRAREADEALDLAWSQLVSLLGPQVRGQALSDPPRPLVPGLNAVFYSLWEHPERLRAWHGVQLAETARALLDPSYATPAQIEAAELRIEQAKAALREVERGLELRAKQLWQTVGERERGWRQAQDRLGQATRDLEIAKKRYASGLIAQIAYARVLLGELTAGAEAAQAYYDFLAAVWDLAEASSCPLEVAGER